MINVPVTVLYVSLPKEELGRVLQRRIEFILVRRPRLLQYQDTVVAHFWGRYVAQDVMLCYLSIEI